MRTIIIFTNSSWNIYNFRLNLIKNLKKNFNVIIISGRDKFSDKIKKISNTYFVNLDNRSTSIIKNLKEIVLLRKFLLLFPNAIILNFTNKSIIIGTISVFFSKLKIINVVTGLGNAFLQKNLINKFLIKLLYVLVNLRSNLIIVQNKYDAIYFKNKLFAKNKVKLIYGSGVNFSKLIPKKRKKTNKKIFLYFGRILREKGIFNFLEAAHYFRDNKNMIFKIVGDYDKKNFSLIEAKKLNTYFKQKNVKYFKFSGNVAKFLNNCDCVVLPTFREGLSKSLLEATVMNKFVICSDVPGCNEIIINNYNGFLVKPNHSKDLILKIKKFINVDDKRKIIMQKKGRSRTYKLFRDEVIIKKYLKILNAL